MHIYARGSSIKSAPLLSILFLLIPVSPFCHAGTDPLITVGLTTDATTYYAFCPVFLTFSITNEGTQALRFSFPEPLDSSGGLYIEAIGEDGSVEDHSGGWHETRRGPDWPKVPSGLRILPEERLTWERFMSWPTGLGPGNMMGLPPGEWRLRARLRDSDVQIDMVSSEVPVHVKPVPKGEEDAAALFKVRQSEEAVEKHPKSLYIPYFLNFLAWVYEEILLQPNQTIDPTGFYDAPNIEKAMKFRGRLRSEYPNWPTTREGYLREAAVRFKIGQATEAIELLNTLTREYPDSAEATAARRGIQKNEEIEANRNVDTRYLIPSTRQNEVINSLGLLQPEREQLK